MLQLKEKMPPLATVDCCLRKWKKIVSISQIISCPLAKLSSFFENCFPRIPIIVSQVENNSDQKALFPLERKSVSTSRRKDLLKYTFPLFEKAALALKDL